VRYDDLISDIEVQIRYLQSRKKNLIEKWKRRNGLALAKVEFRTETYMTVAVVNRMDMSRPLPWVMKWRYVIISGYFLYNPVQDPIVFNVLPGYVIGWGCVSWQKVVMNLYVVC